MCAVRLFSDSFGVPSTTLPTRFQYAGREYDPDTELYYYRARWYDPVARRFISEDPIGLDGGINLYGYVQNNPIALTDPSGLEGDFPAAKKGLEIISNMEPFGTCKEFLGEMARWVGINEDKLIANIQKVASAAKNAIENGETSSVYLNDNDFPGARDEKKGILTMEQYFDSSYIQAAGNVNTATIYLRPKQWRGGFFHSSFVDYSGNPSRFGLATLFHELLHKKMVSGKYATHQDWAPDIDPRLRFILKQDPVADREKTYFFEHSPW